MIPITRFQTSLARFLLDSQSEMNEKVEESQDGRRGKGTKRGKGGGEREVELTFAIEPSFWVAPWSKSLSTSKEDDEKRKSFR